MVPRISALAPWRSRQRQLAPQVGILDLELDLARLGLVAFGVGGFEARLHLGDGCFQLIDRNRHVFRERRHSTIHARAQAGPIGRGSSSDYFIPDGLGPAPERP